MYINYENIERFNCWRGNNAFIIISTNSDKLYIINLYYNINNNEKIELSKFYLLCIDILHFFAGFSIEFIFFLLKMIQT